LREVQRAAFTAELPVTEAVRFGRLHCAEALLFGNQDVPVAACPTSPSATSEHAAQFLRRQR